MALNVRVRRTHFLAFRQIDAILAKLQWSLSEVSCALGLLFGRRLAIDYLFDRLCGEFFGARGAQWRWLFSFGSDSQPELDQAADGLGAVRLMIFGPFIDRGSQLCG